MSAREVTLIGGSPWGFRMHGGHDLHQPLRISRVNPGSKAAQQGVREGDLISSINGRSTKDLTNGEAHTLLRDAGDQLKLGLNQEFVGSPKRRIYKSSLQENTSIETVQRTTKTITTSATRILSSETKKNGTDDTQYDFDLPTQNGGLRHANNPEKNRKLNETTKISYQSSNPNQGCPATGYTGWHINPQSDYATDCEDNSINNNIINIKMPHGSRGRKNRRHRNKRLKHGPTTAVAVAVTGVDNENNSQTPVDSDRDENKNENDCADNGARIRTNEQTTQISKSTSSIATQDIEKLVEAKVNGQQVKVTMEVTSTSSPVIGSILEKRVPSGRRYRLERGALNTQTKICEITSVSGLALEASIGHIAGVGILETGLTSNNNINQCLDSIVTITEPMEPLKPLPSDMTSKVETLGERNFALALLPDSQVVNKNGPEIYEVIDNIDIDMTTMDSSRPAIIIEAESDVEHEMSSARRLKDTIIEESSFDDSDAIDDDENLINKSQENETNVELDKNHINNLVQINSCGFCNNISEQTAIDGVINCANNNELNEESTCDEIDMQSIKDEDELVETSSIKTGGESEFQIFIEELELPNHHDNNLLNNPECVNNDSSGESSEQIMHRRSTNRTMLESYFSGERHTDRFLDIIQEEGEKLSGDEEQHIRDFINEEIGKFQREKRPVQVKCETKGMKIEEVLSDIQENTLSNEKTKLNCQLGDIAANDCDGFLLENEEIHSFAELEGFAPFKYEEEEELNPIDNAREVPSPPRRSSSFTNKDIEPMQPHSPVLIVDYSPPPIPPLPNQIYKSPCGYNCHLPERPPPPNFNIKYDESGIVRSENITCALHNDVSENDGIGNDDVGSANEAETSCLEIAHDHVDFDVARGAPQKIADFRHSSACESQCNVSPCLTSAAASFVEYRRDTVIQDEVESSQPLRPTIAVDEKNEAEKVEVKENKVVKKRPLETQKHECVEEKRVYEEEAATSKNVTIKVEGKIKEYITGVSSVIEVAKDSSELFENNAKGGSGVGGCREFLQQFQTPEEYQKNESLESEVAVENNQASVLNDSSEVAVARNTDSRSNFVDVSTHDLPMSCLHDTVYEDSYSTSATSPSTVKDIAHDTCDVDLVQADLVIEEISPKLKLQLHENGNNNSKEYLSQPIPDSPVDDLYYVGLDADNNCEKTEISADTKPQLLKDLCIKKILSMPYGSKIINEISLAKFNILKNLQTIPRAIESFESLAKEEAADVNSTDKMMEKTRPKSWVGVPTSVNPRMLVCLSPSQQENDVRTSADKLLDLHKKFFNRRSYHEKNNSKNCRRDINVPKYIVQVEASIESVDLKEKNEQSEWSQSNRVSPPSSNRLLEIIKENPISTDSPQVTNAHKNVRQHRSETTGLSDWLTLPQNHYTSENVKDEKISSPHLSTERRRYENGDVETSAFTPVIRTNDRVIISENPSATNCKSKRHGGIFDQVVDDNGTIIKRWLNDGAPRNKRINSALILQSSSDNGVSDEPSIILPLNKNTITQNSAIIDKSPCTPQPPHKRPPQLSCGVIDSSRHINPALINDKPETPPRTRRHVNVDRSCIDTTSIFDKVPPRSHLEPRKYHNPQSLKQATATEIVENLKRLEATKDKKDKLDSRRRYSLPHEIFDRQLKYIEQLENQLKEVILAEEEEQKAFEEFNDHMEKQLPTNDKKLDEARENEVNDNGYENWHEECRVEEKGHAEFMTKEGHRNKTKCVVDIDGRRVEHSSDIFENREENKITATTQLGNDVSEANSEWKKLFHEVFMKKEDESKKIERPRPISILPTSDEIFRHQMYNEYIDKVLEREERKQHKVIKITSHMNLNESTDKSKLSSMNTMEKEFIERAKNRMNRFGINLDASESARTIMQESKSEEITSEVETTRCERHGDKVKCFIDGKVIKDAGKLPKHLQEFLVLATNDVIEDGYGYGNATGEKTNAADLLHEIDKALKVSKGFLLHKGVWSPGSELPPPPKQPSPERGKNTEKDGGIPSVWTPSSASASPVAERKEFRPVSFESPILSRRKKPQSSTDETSPSTARSSNDSNDHQEDTKRDKNITSHNIAHNITSRIVNSHSVPSQGLNTLATATPRLPRAQNPTITLLQKAREGQLPKGAAYLDETVDFHKSQDTASISPDEIIYTVRREYEKKADTQTEQSKKMTNVSPRKIDGIGPITKNGMPVALRSEVTENNQAKWYKQMYDSLHRAGRDDDYVTIRYKPRRGTRYGYGTSSGYLSEPEPRAYIDRSVTLDTRKRQRNKENDSAISTMPRKSAVVKTIAEVYRNQPGRIENYEPGRSLIGEKETKEWWDEVMDIFDGAERRQSQLQHPMALRTFIPTHQLVRINNSVQSTLSLSSSSSPTTTVTTTTTTTTTTQSLHPKSSLRTTRAILEYVDPEIIGATGTTSRENRQTSLINLHHGRSIKSIITPNTERTSYTLAKSPKSERSTSTKNRQRHSRENKTNRETHSDDAIVIGFIDETIKPKVIDDNHWQPLMLEERSKSFIMPSSISPSRRLSPLIGNRSSSSNKERSFVPMTSPRNHRNHHHRQHHDPSISSSTSSSSSSTIHITMLPPPPPPPPITNNTATTVIAETALTSPLTSRPFDQRNQQTVKPYMSHALKESGYESDSTLIFRRRDDVSPLSPLEQRLAYKTVQKGGDVPLHGFRKPAPERPKDDTEIQYFPITSTLTRIRVRRRNVTSSSRTSSPMSSSLTLAHSKKAAQSSVVSSIIPLSRANLVNTIIESSGRPPSPPRRHSSRHNATLKLYISTRYPQTLNRRHEQCFTVESTSKNIRFLRERLSNKLLKHDQRREHRDIVAHRSLTSLQNTSTTLSTTKTKLPTRLTTVASKHSKIDSYLSKRTQEYLKPINSVGRVVDFNQRTVDTKQKSKEDNKPSIVRAPSKTFLSQDTSGRSTVRSKSLQTCQKKDQAKNCKTKCETVKSSKRGSSADSSSPVEVGRVLNSRRQGDVGSTLTGSVIKTNSTLRRVKSQDIGLPKVISKSREFKKTTTPSSLVRSGAPTTLLNSSIRRPTQLDTISKSKSSNTSKLRDKNVGVLPITSIVFNDSVGRKIIPEKPQIIIKKTIKKPDADVYNKEVRVARKKGSIKREKTREVTKTRNNTERIECGRKTDRKSSGKSKIEESSKNITTVDGVTPSLTMERIKKHHEATRTDSFFQNLFLRNVSSPTPSQCSTLDRRSSVMERARMFQALDNAGFKSEPSLRTINVYLATKQPVSNSRFKNWERQSLSSRSSSPYGVSWPGRSVFQKINKFDSLQRINDFGSCNSLRGRSPDIDNDSTIKERSVSEPPIKLSSITNGSTKISSRAPSRSSSPSPTRSPTAKRIQTYKQQEKQEFPTLKTRARSAGDAEYKENRKINLGSNLSLTKSTSSIESPPINRDDYQRYVFEILHSKRKSTRYKDLHDFYASLERMGELERTTSTNDLRRRLRNEDIIDYDRWKDLRCKERAEVELHNLYGKLKAAQREKDFLFSTKDVERYRWKGDCGLRCKERSVENIRESFQRLEQRESELESTRRRDIASKKDVYKPLWRGNSVVNVANTMTIRAAANGNKQDENDKWTVQPSLQKSLGGSKKFWSSLSVEQVNVLKNQLNEIYGSENSREKISPRLLESVEPVETIIAQENIEKSPLEMSTIKSEFEVIVPSSRHIGDEVDDRKGLSVRCHSLFGTEIKSSSKLSSSLKRSDSISNGRPQDKSATMSFTEMEKKRLSLTLSHEIMDKVLQRKNSKSPVTPRETRGAIAAASAKDTTKNTCQSTSTSNTSPRTCYSLEASLDDESLSKTRDKSDFLLVLTPNDENSANCRLKVENVLDKWSKKPPLLAMTMPNNNIGHNKNICGGEIDSMTESSENSVKTVVQCANEMDVVPKKVEFFESIQRDKRNDENNSYLSIVDGKKTKSVLSSSQSYADLKELFGQVDSSHYATLPFRSPVNKREDINVSCCITSSGGSVAISGEQVKRGRSTSASLDVPCGRFSSATYSRYYYNDRPRSVSPCRVSTSTCSLESIRHRSISPDPERYWRTYLSLVRHGAVQKLRAKFESLEELSGNRNKFILKPKRFRSDPELTRNFLNRITNDKKLIFKCQDVLPDVGWLRHKYEPSRARTKRRVTRSPPIPKIPLRLEDLTMPHINVISKTAELKDNAMSRSSSSNSLAIKTETEEIEALRPVGRIRDKFEKMETDKMSILGEMFTSAPDVHELRDIAPYLAGRWVAHKYPNRRDNARSLSLPPDLENSRECKAQQEKVRSSDKSALVKNGRDRIKGLRTISPSPVLSQTPTSILKQRHTDPFADQPFDASKHRPRYRYQPPPPPPPPPPALKIRRETKTWWPPIPTYTARPTVTFEGPQYTNAPPLPPPKSQHCRSDYQESPRRYVEGEVTIHYRSPVRTEAKEILSEEELARRSAENMRRVYQEERRRKYLQELHDIDSRRHTDNFIPSQKSPIPLNRYDDFVDDLSYLSRSQEQTPEPRLVARAMYNFVGQTSRELSFRRGDIIIIRRQIDKNWYEGEHNATVGLFPLNYVEILPYDGTRSTPKKSYEGQARAKFNFIAQTNLELSLAKGELVVVTRRVDENWYEGRIGNKKGIFPVTYVEVIVDPGQHRPETPVSSKPVASPAAHSMLSNGTASGKLSMGPHHYTPSIPVKTNATEPQYISLPRIGVTERNKLHVAPVNETLHIDTHSDTTPYRALYNYRPQNEDELELKEGDMVYVMEKCDDGWFVGSSQRTGYFGTFPGNYVERL